MLNLLTSLLARRVFSRRATAHLTLGVILVAGLAVCARAAGVDPRVAAQAPTSATSSDTLALQFGVTIRGAISAPGEIDTFTFVGNAGEHILLRVEPDGVWTHFAGVLELYGPNGSLLVQKVDTYVSSGNYGGLQLSILDYALPASGTYGVRFRERTGLLTSAYWMRIESREREYAAARPLEMLTTYRDTLAAQGQIKPYKFTGNAGEHIQLRLEPDGSWTHFAGILELYGPSDTLLVQKADTQVWSGNYGGLQLSILDYALPESGTYTFTLREDDGNETSAYWMRIESREREYAAARPLEMLTTYRDTLAAQGQIKPYKFTGNAGEHIQLRLEPDGSWTHFAGILELYGPSDTLLVQKADTQVWSGNYGGLQLSILDYALPESGTYTFTLREDDGNETSAYWMRIESREREYAAARPLEMLTTYRDTLAAQGQIKPYKFTGNAGEHIQLRLEPDGSWTHFAGILELYGPSDTLLVQKADTYVSSGNYGGLQLSILDYALPESGTYTFTLREDDGNETSAYWMRIESREREYAAARPLEMLTTYRDTLAAQGQIKPYKFTGNAGEHIQLRLEPDGSWTHFAGILELYGPSDTLLVQKADTQVWSGNYGGLQLSILDYALPESGTYTFTLREDDGNETSAYWMRIESREREYAAARPLEMLTTYRDTLAAQGQIKPYKFTGNAGEHIQLRLEPDGSWTHFAGILELYGPSDTLLVQKADTQVWSGNYGGLQLSILDYALPESGTYTFTLREDDGNETSAYWMRIESREREYAAARPLEMLTTYRDTLAAQGQIKPYKFTGNAGEHIQLRLEPDGSWTHFAGILELYGPSDTLLVQKADTYVSSGNYGGLQLSILDYALPESGTYTFTLREDDGNETSAYWMRIESRERELLQGPTLSYGSTRRDTLAQQGQVKAYRFAGNAGDHILARLDPDGVWTHFAGILELYGPSDTLLVQKADTQVWSGNYGGLQLSILDYALPMAGVYTLYLREDDGNETSAYWMSLNSREDLAAHARVIPLSTAVTTVADSSISAFGHMDAFGFDGVAGQYVTLRMQSTGDPYFDSRLELFGPADSLVASDWDRAPGNPIAQAAVSQFLLPQSGRYTIYCSEMDGDNNSPYWMSLVRIGDVTVPTVAIVSGPANGDTVGTDSTRFSFTGADNQTPTAQLRYSWSLDSGAFTTPAADTSVLLTGLADGVHALAVHSVDLDDNLSANTTRTWHVAAAAPVIVVTVPAEGAHVGTTSVLFGWNATSGNTASDQIVYRAAMDTLPGGPFTRDTSATFSGLAAAAHVLHVEAKDRFGRVGSLARNFRVDTTPPNTSIASGPLNGWANTTSVNVTWSGTDDVSATGALRYAFRVDSSAYGAPSSATGTTLTGLAEGAHTLYVRAVDEADNADLTPASLPFRVDLTAPQTQIISGPADSALIAVNSAMYGLAGSDDFSSADSLTYQWRVDGGAWSAAWRTPAASLSALAEGTHTVVVRAVDLAGNADPTPATRTLFTDALPPAVTFVAGPGTNSCQVADSVTFAWSGNDELASFASLTYSSTLDGEAPTPFDHNPLRTLTGLAEGTHTLVVQARDGVGHVGSLGRAFTVDHTAPMAFMPTTRLLDNSTVGIQCTGTDNTGVSGFHVQVSSDTSFATLLLDTQLAASGTGSYVGTPGHSYFARAQALDCAGNVSAWSGRGNGSTVANLSDLVSTQVVVPTALTAMQTFPVTYTVKNQGIGSTNAPQWSDDLYLSPTPTFNPATAQFLGRVVNQRALAPNEAYSTTTNVTVPMGTSGDEYVLVVADVLDNVPESDGTNNLRASAVIPATLGNYADLVVTQVVAPPTTLSGTAVTVRWTVTNQGTGRTNADRWWDTVLISPDSLFNYTLVGGSNLRVLDTPLGAFQHVGALDPGQGYTVAATVVVPENGTGRLFFLLASDLYATAYGQNVSERGNVFENTNEVNWASAEPTLVTLQPPSDLVAVSATVGDSATSGKRVAVSWTVRNGGFNDTPPVVWQDRVWLSSDPVFGNDVLLGTFSHVGPLALDSTYTAHATVGLPAGISGSFRLFVQTDGGGAVSEYREDNNVVQALVQVHEGDPPAPADTLVQVTPSSPPNLRMVSGVLPDTVAAGGTAVVQWTGTNSGTGAAIDAWSDDVVLSQSATWPGTGTGTSMGGARQSRTLAVGEVYTAGMSFTVPTGWSGRWYAYARTDVNNEVYENTDEGDNVTPIGSVVVRQYPPVDLVVSGLSVPASAAAGGTLAVSFTVTNQGQATTLGSSWGEEVWLSADTQLGAGDILLSSPGHGGSLAAGASYSRSYTPALANGFSGTYYVIVRSDWGGTTGDTSLPNNTAVSASPVVFTADPPADLVVQSVSTPSAGTAGQPLRVTWSMKNQGAGTVPVGATWNTGVYLSQDPYLDGSDVPLGTRSGPAGLAPGASDPESLDVSLPTWASGGYYVIVSADISNAVWESSDANNASAYPVSLTLAPPSDLVVTDVQVPPVAIPGQVVSVSFTLANIGANAAVGQMQNAVYASADGAFQATSDPLVGISTMNVNLAPGAAQRFTQRMAFASPLRVDLAGNVTGLLPPLNPGPYHAIVRTNIRANVRELDLTNNEGVSAATLQTTVDSLALEVPVVTALASGQAVFYRVRVPAGQDLSFTLSSSDTNATNEMFVAYGRTPSGNDYDYAGPPEFTDAPEVLVPGTLAGEYFVMVVARDLGSGPSSEQVRLTARTLPFQVTSVSPSRGGQGGMVTVRLRGAGFRSTTVTKLRDYHLNILTGRLVKLTNSSDMLVQFDLSQVGNGTFDLEVTTGTDAVTMPAAFVVEPATPAAIEISVAHADVVRRTATAMFVFSFTNPSNQDVPVLRARLLYPATSQLRRLETSAGLLRRSDRAPELFAPMTGDVAPLRRADGTDSLMAIDLVGSNLSPGETRTVTLGVSGFETSPYSVRALAEALTLGTFLSEEVQRNETARGWLLANPAGVPTDVIAAAGDPLAFRDSALVRNLAGGGLLDAAVIRDSLIAHSGQLPVPGLPGSPGPPELLAELTGGPCLWPRGVPECVPDVAALTSALPACRVCVTASGIPIFERVAAGGVAQVPASLVVGYSVTKSADVRVVSPCDPNDMTGPAGFGDQHWVKGGAPLAYRVDFENLAEVAHSPAQVVTVSVPMDAGLDLTTFRLGTLGFGTHTVDASSQGGRTYDDEPFFLDLGLYVHVTCSIEPAARRAIWTLTSLDPVTMLRPTNAFVGFLPVNNTAGQGMGYMTYTVQPLAGLKSGTSVQAQASIQFDANVPVSTPTAVNRVDNGVPVSAVLTNLAVLDTTHVRVSWTCTDDTTGSGSAGVSLYMKQDAGSYRSVGDNLTTGQLQVPVRAGHNYAFYTLATDNAGNIEPTKTGPDASVYVPVVQLGVDSLRVPRVTMLHPAYPNPCRDLAMVRFDLARAGVVSVEVYDVQGRRVAHPLDGKRFVAGTHTLALTGLPRAAGVYFVRMRTDGYAAVRRLVMLR